MPLSNVILVMRPSCLRMFCCIFAFFTVPWLLALAPVNAITTKLSPPSLLDTSNTSHLVVNVNNNNNNNPFVQIRSATNQPTRAFVVEQKSALSPVQQTHILDDVQKNQRVHYYQPAFASSSFSSAPTTSAFQNEASQQMTLESASKLSNDYVDFNAALSAPALQTVVLSPQQSLPTSPSFVNEYISEPSLSLPYSTSASSHRIPSATASAPISVAAPIQVGRQSSSSLPSLSMSMSMDNRNSFTKTKNSLTASTAAGSSPIRYTSSSAPYSNIGAKSQVINSYNFPGVRSTGEQYPKYEQLSTDTGFATALPAASSSSSTSSPKAYHRANNTSGGGGIFSPLLEKAQHKYRLNKEPTPSPSDKFVKEVYLKMNPEILIAKDRQKFFQQLLEGGHNRSQFQLADDDDDVDVDSKDQTVAQNDLSNVRNQLFEKEFLQTLKHSAAMSGNSSANGFQVSEFSLPSGQKIQISKDYNRLLLDQIEGSDGDEQQTAAASNNNKIKAIVVKQLTSTTVAPKTNILEELTKGVVPPGAEFEVIKRNKDGALEEVSKLPQNIPQKKVTFVILEEQADGTVRVQGVRGSEKESLKESGEEVDTIIKKIKQGELKLPPSTRLSPKQQQQHSSSSLLPPLSSSAKKHSGKNIDQYETKSKRRPATINNGNGNDENEAGIGFRTHQRRKEQQQHFIPTPIVQTYTTPESFKSDTYATAMEDSTSYQSYYSSPSTLYNIASTPPSDVDADADADGERHNDGSGTVATSILNHLVGDGRVNANSALSPDPSSSIGDSLGLLHLNSSGYIASLFSALKTHPHPPSQIASQLPFLPTTLGHRTVQQQQPYERERDDNSTTISEDGTTSSSSNYGYGGASTNANAKANGYEYETAKASTANNKRDREKEKDKKRDRNVVRKNGAKRPLNKETRKDNDEEESNVETTETKSGQDTAAHHHQNSTLSDVLKKEGFYAMARFLRQSGLDSILNDTGPFTLFIPTDKAFRTLLIQLGGPDKAEEKFKENPRLLSGLLLHHVIPGAFRVTTLQDEMTGVSLAGTQLRVNTYTTHDIEWNDITVVTVNGAKILDEKDIVIPQGIAHAIDRVMFPLPVGNLLQSLQADRENRYSNFLKILEESQLSYLLTGGKTFTLFAPLNRAFTHAEFTKILADANESKSFVLRHTVPGALYSAGMKYYQVRDSMEDGQQITLYKEAGKIKVNNAHVVTRNIPATNGVIHAIDAFL